MRDRRLTSDRHRPRITTPSSHQLGPPSSRWSQRGPPPSTDQQQPAQSIALSMPRRAPPAWSRRPCWTCLSERRRQCSHRPCSAHPLKPPCHCTLLARVLPPCLGIRTCMAWGVLINTLPVLIRHTPVDSRSITYLPDAVGLLARLSPPSPPAPLAGAAWPCTAIAPAWGAGGSWTVSHSPTSSSPITRSRRWGWVGGWVGGWAGGWVGTGM